MPYNVMYGHMREEILEEGHRLRPIRAREGKRSSMHGNMGGKSRDRISDTGPHWGSASMPYIGGSRVGGGRNHGMYARGKE